MYKYINKPVMLEMFSGIGSQVKALKKLNMYYDVYIAEWDISAFYAYSLIHDIEVLPNEKLSKAEILEFFQDMELSVNSKTPVSMKFLSRWSEESLLKIYQAFRNTKNIGNIEKAGIHNIPKNIDILTYSFPCQDLSLCMAWHGNTTGISREVKNRSGLLWEVGRLLQELKDNNYNMPKFLLMENVSNILSNPHKKYFDDWQQCLSNMGYINIVHTLYATECGNPQKRKRTYMLSILHNDPFGELRTFCEQYFRMDHNKEYNILDYLRLDYNNIEYAEEAHDSNMNDTPSRRIIHQENIIIYDKKICSNTINTITTRQDRNPTAGLIMYPERRKGHSPYRNLTPRECFLFMGFDESDFQRLKDNNIEIFDGKCLYTRNTYERLAGNSIVVDVLVVIFNLIRQLQSKYPELTYAR